MTNIYIQTSNSMECSFREYCFFLLSAVQTCSDGIFYAWTNLMSFARWGKVTWPALNEPTTADFEYTLSIPLWTGHRTKDVQQMSLASFFFPNQFESVNNRKIVTYKVNFGQTRGKKRCWTLRISDHNIQCRTQVSLIEAVNVNAC